jgi:site-specific DNA-methyltransferase (adenine-specific)
MAELTWSGKQRIDATATLASQQYYFNTIAHYPSTPDTASTTEKTWSNRLILGDKAQVLPLLLAEFRGAINLIYIDPPFMTGRTFYHSDGTRIAYRDIWQSRLDGYLQWLYETLIILHALLASNGSLYLHLDWRTAHYARVLLDEVFATGVDDEGAGFKNEIIWHYQSGGRARRYYARKHDTIFLYTKSAQYCFHPERVGEKRGTQRRNHMRREIDADGHVTWTIRSAGRVYTYDENSLLTLSDVWSDIHHLHQKDPERSGYATQKPEALLERIILASSEEHDLILDCFCGSGVTPLVAERLRRRWLAVDQSDLAIATTIERLQRLEQRQAFTVQKVVPSIFS